MDRSAILGASDAVRLLSAGTAAGVADRLFAAAFGDLSEAKRQAYVDHLLLRLLDWSIRGGRAEEIDFWLARAGDLLPA